VSDVDFKPVRGAFVEGLDEAAAERLAAEIINIPCSDISVEIILSTNSVTRRADSIEA